MNEKLIRLFRAVGVEEYYSVMRTKKFACHPEGSETKYFGIDFEETLAFANEIINIEIIAVIEIGVLYNILTRIGDFTYVDPFLFKKGTVEIPHVHLDEFNSAIKYITHKF
ncbi:MAG: hypothetical protein FWF92_10750 [Oscillospiraceae bacterium]|nr:hypothetical protein [Oscillospiraceae bacterium]